LHKPIDLLFSESSTNSISTIMRVTCFSILLLLATSAVASPDGSEPDDYHRRTKGMTKGSKGMMESKGKKDKGAKTGSSSYFVPYKDPSKDKKGAKTGSSSYYDVLEDPSTTATPVYSKMTEKEEEEAKSIIFAAAAAFDADPLYAEFIALTNGLADFGADGEITISESVPGEAGIENVSIQINFKCWSCRVGLTAACGGALAAIVASAGLAIAPAIAVVALATSLSVTSITTIITAVVAASGGVSLSLLLTELCKAMKRC
jgi:hypothetical protein